MITLLITIEEARDTLRLDGEDNDIIIIPLLEAIPSYLEVTTGRTWEDEPVHPLAQTATKFILQLWYAPEAQDGERIKRTIDNLLIAMTALGRGMD